MNKEHSETLGKELGKPDGHSLGSKGRTEGTPGRAPLFPRRARGFLLQKRCTLLTAAPNAGCRILTRFSKVRSRWSDRSLPPRALFHIGRAFTKEDWHRAKCIWSATQVTNADAMTSSLNLSPEIILHEGFAYCSQVVPKRLRGGRNFSFYESRFGYPTLF